MDKPLVSYNGKLKTHIFGGIMEFLDSHSNSVHDTLKSLFLRRLNTNFRFKLREKFILQAIAATCSSLSMVAAFIAFYWFCRMHKRFRHRYSSTDTALLFTNIVLD